MKQKQRLILFNTRERAADDIVKNSCLVFRLLKYIKIVLLYLKSDDYAQEKLQKLKSFVICLLIPIT